MKSLLEADTAAVTIVGKSSDYQAKAVLGVTPEENIEMIADTVRYLRSNGRQVLYDAEHFFDTFKANPNYAMQTLLAAQEAGASVLVLCDTNGGSMPEFIAEATAAVKAQTSVTVGIHTHNDGGVADRQRAALAAVRRRIESCAGDDQRRGRAACGNMDLIALIANLQLKYNLDCLQPGRLAKLTDVSRYVYETANMNLVSGPARTVGSSGLPHKGGIARPCRSEGCQHV